jgi:hypothetical protein
MLKTKIIYFLSGMVVGIIGFLGFVELNHQYKLYQAKHRKPSSVLVPYHPTGSAEHPNMLYPADPSNNQILMGASHNVFIGKVLAQTGNKETEIGPRTQYQVQVIDSIKGDLTDIITVDMLGGYDKDGKLVLVESEDLRPEDALFQPGSTYLFATRYNAQEDWYTVIAHPNARKVLSKDSTLPSQALKALAERDEKVKQFAAAYVSEIPDKADVANNNTRNSFQSLPPEAKAAAQSRADAAKASLAASAKAQ